MPITREALLDGATDLLRSRSGPSVTVDELARHLRMSKSTLYRFFESREDLFEALQERLVAEAQNDLASVAEDADPVRRFEAFVEAYARHAERTPRGLLVESMQATRRLFSRAFEDVFEALGPNQRWLGGPAAAALEAGATAAVRGEIPHTPAAAVRQVGEWLARGLVRG